MTGKRWWWWLALAGAIANAATIPVSFRWIMDWTDSGNRCYCYIEHGVLHGNNIQVKGATPPIRPWYGSFQFFSSPIYDPWVVFPGFAILGGGAWSFKLPLHVPLLALLAVLALPMLPPVVRRRRRKRGLCVKCAYDLTGNVSGVCPECGTAVEP